MLAIIYWMMRTCPWQRSSGIRFVYLTLVTRISLLKSNLTIGLRLVWVQNQCKKNSPVKLLLLGLLRCLGRGWTFDDIEEQTAISINVHCKFFHAFIDFGCTTLETWLSMCRYGGGVRKCGSAKSKREESMNSQHSRKRTER